MILLEMFDPGKNFLNCRDPIDIYDEYAILQALGFSAIHGLA
jgi:hypothetical protein